jgi:hypothetical protein
MLIFANKRSIMQRITLEIEKAADLELLLLLIHRMGIAIVASPAPASLPVQLKKDRQWHLQVVAKGGNMSYIPDPVAWQREIRQDKSLPFRED